MSQVWSTDQPVEPQGGTDRDTNTPTSVRYHGGLLLLSPPTRTTSGQIEEDSLGPLVSREYFKMVWLRGKREVPSVGWVQERERESVWSVIGLNTIIIMSQFRAAQAPH